MVLVLRSLWTYHALAKAEVYCELTKATLHEERANNIVLVNVK